MLLVPVPSRFAMSLALNSTRSVLKSGSMKEDTFSKQPVYVVVPGTMVNDNRAPVSTKTDEPGVCPVSLRVTVPATGLSTVRVTQTLSFVQPCVAMDTTVGSLTAWTGPADNATAAATASAPSRRPQAGGTLKLRRTSRGSTTQRCELSAICAPPM